jgi:hypothetical protein
VGHDRFESLASRFPVDIERWLKHRRSRSNWATTHPSLAVAFEVALIFVEHEIFLRQMITAVQVVSSESFTESLDDEDRLEEASSSLSL